MGCAVFGADCRWQRGGSSSSQCDTNWYGSQGTLSLRGPGRLPLPFVGKRFFGLFPVIMTGRYLGKAEKDNMPRAIGRRKSVRDDTSTTSVQAGAHAAGQRGTVASTVALSGREGYLLPINRAHLCDNVRLF